MNIGDVTLRRRMEWIVSTLDADPLCLDDTILDVGCGDGLYANLFDCDRYWGIDNDEKMILRAKALHPFHRFGMVYPYFQFDRIICTEVLEHVSSPLWELRNLRLLLKPDGIALVTVPCNYYPFWFDPTRRWSRHGHLFSPYEIKTICENAGFLVEKCELLTQHVIPFYYQLIHAGAVIHHKIPIPGTNRYGKPPSWINPLRWAKWLIDAVDARNDFNPQWQTNLPSVNIALKLRLR